MLTGINSALLLALCASAIACGGTTNQAPNSRETETRVSETQETHSVSDAQLESPGPGDPSHPAEEDSRPLQPRKALSFFRAPDPGLRAQFMRGSGLGLDSLDQAQTDLEVLVDKPQVPAQVVEQEGLLVLDGFLRCPETGLQTFRVEAKGSASLWVSGENICESLNPTNEAPIEGSIALEEGWHALRLAWKKAPEETDLGIACGAAGAELSAPEADRWAH